MEAYHDPTDEPVCESKFDWSFNDADLPVDTWRVMMYSEILDFHQTVGVANETEVPNNQTCKWSKTTWIPPTELNLQKYKLAIIEINLKVKYVLLLLLTLHY